MLRYHVILFDRSTGRDFSASCVNPDKQCIIHCLWSKSAIILRSWSPIWTSRFVADEQLWPNPVDNKIWGNMSYQKKVQNVNYLTIWGCFWLMCELDWTERWHWSIGDWPVTQMFHACIGATGGHYDYSLWHILVKTLLTVINYVKIYC